MTNEMMALQGRLEKASDADLVREMLGFAAERLPPGACWPGLPRRGPRQRCRLPRELDVGNPERRGARRVRIAWCSATATATGSGGRGPEPRVQWSPSARAAARRAGAALRLVPRAPPTPGRARQPPRRSSSSSNLLQPREDPSGVVGPRENPGDSCASPVARLRKRTSGVGVLGGHYSFHRSARSRLARRAGYACARASIPPPAPPPSAASCRREAGRCERGGGCGRPADSGGHQTPCSPSLIKTA